MDLDKSLKFQTYYGVKAVLERMIHITLTLAENNATVNLGSCF